MRGHDRQGGATESREAPSGGATGKRTLAGRIQLKRAADAPDGATPGTAFEQATRGAATELP